MTNPNDAHTVGPVILYNPVYRLGHPENYLFLLSKINIYSGKVSPKCFMCILKQDLCLGQVNIRTKMQRLNWSSSQTLKKNVRTNFFFSIYFLVQRYKADIQSFECHTFSGSV